MKLKRWMVWCLIMFLLFSFGCVPVYHYQYEEPIDIIYDYPPKVINVYVPRHRPSPMYYYNGIYYSEPYTTMLYRDTHGRVGPRKIPNSVLRKIHRQHSHPPVIKKAPRNRQNFFQDAEVDQKYDRRLNRKRIRNRR